MKNAHQTGKEFRIMILKMIKNLKNKMELQVNSLETRTEKMQELFNKDPEEIKKSQYIMNTTINLRSKTLWREPTVEQRRQKIG